MRGRKTVPLYIFTTENTAKKMVLVDLNTVPDHMRMDYETRNENVREGRKLCGRCNGTGNEMFSMFRLCEECLGNGWKK